MKSSLKREVIQDPLKAAYRIQELQDENARLEEALTAVQLSHARLVEALEVYAQPNRTASLLDDHLIAYTALSTLASIKST